LREALLGSRELGDTREILHELCRVAFLLAATKRSAIAARLLSGAEALLEEMGTAESWGTNMNQKTRDLIRSQLGEDALVEAWERGRSLTIEDGFALGLESLNTTSER
jgi:hypothetical protein